MRGELPGDLVADLRLIADPKVDVPGSFDDSVLNRARAHFAGNAGSRARARARFGHRRIIAIAASIALVTGVAAIVLFTSRTLRFEPRVETPATIAAGGRLGDVNLDLRVNIVDALVLARAIETGSANDRRWDVTGDDAVDRADVDFIAMVATTVFAATSQDGGNGIDPAMHFKAIEVFIDAGESPLAAWQVEFVDAKGIAKIVGIETGEHAAFPNAPKYDPNAMQNERAIVADFSLAGAESLPTGRVRVTTIHVTWEGDVHPEFQVTLSAAAGVDGEPIEGAKAETAGE